MSGKENLEEVPKERTEGNEDKSPEVIKRKVQLVEKELNRLSNMQWAYAKRLLIFGWAAWIFGFSAFFSSLLIYKGPGIITDAPSLALSLLVLAGAAPVIITLLLVLKHRKRMDRLDSLRENLLSRYEQTLLKKVEENIA